MTPETCHDCGAPREPDRLLAIVGNERRAYCAEHGEARWRGDHYDTEVTLFPQEVFA
jgi:hypothetical protein